MIYHRREAHAIPVRREIIANHPTGVLAMRLEASEAGQLNVDISLSRSQHVTSNTASTADGVNSIVMKANSGNANPISFTAEAQVSVSGGKLAFNLAMRCMSLIFCLS